MTIQGQSKRHWPENPVHDDPSFMLKSNILWLKSVSGCKFVLSASSLPIVMSMSTWYMQLQRLSCERPTVGCDSFSYAAHDLEYMC